MDDTPETQAEHLDRILSKYLPKLPADRRRQLIATLPVYLWSVYGGRAA